METQIVEKIEQIKTSNKVFLDSLSSLIVRNEEDYTTACTYIAEIKGRVKMIKKRKDEIVGPFKDQVKKIEDMFKEQIVPLDLALERLEQVSVAYYREQQRRAEEQRIEAERLRQAELARLEEEQKKKEEEVKKLEQEAINNENKRMELEQKQQEIMQIQNESAIVETMPLVDTVEKTKQTSAGKVTMRRDKKFRILDENVVPDQFWIIDEVALRKHIMTENLEDQPDRPAIPGVQIYYDYTPSSR